MDGHRENISPSFAGCPAIAQPSKFLGSPGPQTSLSTSSRISLNRTLTYLHPSVFKLPDELILSILSHISPDLRATGHCAWFRDSYDTGVYDSDCNQRKQILRRLSMTCRAMRLRFVPWVWEHLEVSSVHYRKSEAIAVIADALHADAFLATSVRYFHIPLCLWIKVKFYSVSSEGL